MGELCAVSQAQKRFKYQIPFGATPRIPVWPWPTLPVPRRDNLVLGTRLLPASNICAKARDPETDVSAWIIMGCSRQLVQSVR